MSPNWDNGSSWDGFLSTIAENCLEQHCTPPPTGAMCDPEAVTESYFVRDFGIGGGFNVLGIPNTDDDNVRGLICEIEAFIENNRPNHNGNYYSAVDIDFHLNTYDFCFDEGCENEGVLCCGSCATNTVTRNLGLTVTYAVCLASCE